MRKLGLMFLTMVLLTSGVAQAQKKFRKPPIAPTPQIVIIQDEAGEGFMLFDLVTGAYKCTLCEYDYAFSGVGSLKTDGCNVFFSAQEDGYSMTAYVDLCEQTAKCAIQVFKANGFDIEPWEETLSDSDLRNSEATCGTVEPPPAALPTEVILQNDVDGSFLLIVPATGEFKFIHCADNTAMSGVGKATTSGPWLNFEAITKEYRILASVNLELKNGKAVVDVFSPFGEMVPMQEIISDGSFLDNVPQCGAKKF